MPLHALRAAITLDTDSAGEVRARTTTLLETLYERNGLTHDSVVSILFTATSDITSAPPAAARTPVRPFGCSVTLRSRDARGRSLGYVHPDDASHRL